MELLGTVADRASAGEYWLSALGILPDPDPVLRKMGEEASILASLEADEQVTAMAMARKNRVLNHQNYCFKPGSLKKGSPTETEVLMGNTLTSEIGDRGSYAAKTHKDVADTVCRKMNFRWMASRMKRGLYIISPLTVTSQTRIMRPLKRR